MNGTFVLFVLNDFCTVGPKVRPRFRKPKMLVRFQHGAPVSGKIGSSPIDANG